MSSTRQYTDTVGKKFHADGSVRHYPGNTIICYCDPDENAYEQSEWVQNALKQSPIGNHFSLLPLSSLHMTVMQLLVDEVRVPQKWSSKLALDATLVDTDAFFIEVVSKLPKPRNFAMAYKQFYQGKVGLSIRLQPANEETQHSISSYRNLVAEATGVRFADHDTYEFHISLAYQIIQLSPENQQVMDAFCHKVDAHLQQHFQVFDSGEPYLTFFDNMHAFVTSDKRTMLKSRQRQDQ